MQKDKWKKTLINKDSTIKDAIVNLSSSGLQICILVNEKNTIIGTITDGDIRRSIINGVNLQDSAISIANKNPVTSSNKRSFLEIKSLMEVNKINQLPIINNNKAKNLVYI